MVRKMTRFARALKCGAFGASGSASGLGPSAASSSETMPGSSSEPPTSEWITERREMQEVVTDVPLTRRPRSVHVNELVGAQQRPPEGGPRLRLGLAGGHPEGRQSLAVAPQELP